MSQKERPTETFKTENGYEVTVKSYATGREANKIQAVYMQSAKVTVVGQTPRIEGFDLGAEEKAIEMMVELLVVSVKDPDGNVNENAVDSVLDGMPKPDFDEVLDKLNELTGKKKAESSSSQ